MKRLVVLGSTNTDMVICGRKMKHQVLSVFAQLFLSLGFISSLVAGERRLSLDEYRDKMQGAWIGQMVGVEWGMSTEFKFREVIIPEKDVPVWKPELINGAFNNDDLYVEMTFLKTLEDHGLDVSQRQAGIDFANSEYRLWCANLAGRLNLRKGIAPPDSSHPCYNRCPNDIDYQIEADYSGIIAPGCPQEVIRLGNVFGRLMNFGDGVWAGQFVGAMYAEAFFTQDVNRLLDAGLKAIPAESDYAQMVRNVRIWHRENPADWTKTWEKIRAKYSKKFNPALKASNGGIDVRLNGAMIILGLLYGEGDLDKSMVISMRGGWDSDCNPSNVGGILMCACGAKALPAKYASKLDFNRRYSYTVYDQNRLYAVCEKLARAVIVRAGGRVEKGADGREWFVIPEQDPSPDAFVPSWQAGPAAGERFTAEEMAKVKFPIKLPDAPALDDPDPTRRVQKALDALWPGWKTSVNGADMRPGYRESFETTKGQVYGSVLTHPPAKGQAVTLSRTLKVPEGNPKLHFAVANSSKGDFRLVVRINGADVLATLIENPKEGDRHGYLRSYDMSLEPWAGKDVTIELVNEPTGWKCEAAVWHDLRITANNGAGQEPVKVIFDTDMITDFDDVGALACLHALADEGKCEILATVSCTRGNASVAAIEVINAYYGRADLPVGCAKEIGVIGASDKAKTKVDPKSPLTGFKGADGWHYRYRKLAADYPQWVRHLDSDDAPDANEVYRSVLAAQPDHSVVICSVGFLTNLRRLLETKPDRHSPLDGRALVAQKVKGWVAMGFAYPRGAEYNTKGDAESTKIVMDNWPTPAVFSDWTYGGDLFAGRAVAEMAGPRNPVKDVFAGSIPSREEVLADPLGWYKKCFGLGGRAAWDETTVLAAVLGTDGLFNVEYGTFEIDAKTGHNEWVPDYLRKGNRMRLTEKTAKSEVGRLIDELICRSPVK